MGWKKISEKIDKGFSRRTFIKGAAATAAAISLAGCSKDDDDSDYTEGLAGNAPDLREVRKVYSTCPVECLTHSLNCQLVGDEVIRVEPTVKPNDYYYTTACGRGMSRMQFLTENRVTTPMKRIKRGSAVSPLGVVLKNNDIDEWVSISWNQAVSEIGAKLRQLKAENEKGMMVWTGSGNMGPIANGVIGNFFDHVNPNRSTKLGNSCCEGVDDGMKVTFGARSIDTRDTVSDAKCIINWGNNPADTSNTYWKFFMAAKEKGAKIITIDPRFNSSAERSDQWIAIKPGTDTLFAIGMLRKIFIDSNDDKEFLKHRTNAPYLIDISAIMDGDTGNFILKPYNELYKVKYKQDAEGKELVYSNGATVAAEKNTGKNTSPTQTPDLEYVDLAGKVATAYQLMRALYAGDEIFKTDNTKFAALHDPYYTDAKIVSATGISGISVLEDCVTAYVGSDKKSMIIENMGGAQRTENGGHVCALHCILALVTGNVGGRGNGVDDTSGWSSLNGFQTGDLKKNGSGMRLLPAEKGKTHPIPFGVLGRRAQKANNNVPEDIFLPTAAYPAGTKDPAIKFWYIATSNLLTQFPNTDSLKEALRSSETVVVAKPTWNTDADYADYFLPVTTPFEYEDLGAANRNKYISLMEAGVKPYGQARSDMQILRDMAKIVFDDPAIIANFDHDDTWYVEEIIANPANNFATNGIPDYNTLKTNKSMRPLAILSPWVPYRNHEFLEAQAINGRAKIFITDWGYETSTPVYAVVPYPYIKVSPNPAKNLLKGPFPRYVPALESQLEPLPDFADIPADFAGYRRDYPLACVQFKTARTVHASFTGLPWIREAFGEKGIVLINTADALERNISDGEKVTVRSHTGAVERIARVTEFIMQGVTAIENGWWDKFGKISSSTVGAELPDPMGCGHTHNNTLVEIFKGEMK